MKFAFWSLYLPVSLQAVGKILRFASIPRLSLLFSPPLPGEESQQKERDSSGLSRAQGTIASVLLQTNAELCDSLCQVTPEYPFKGSQGTRDFHTPAFSSQGSSSVHKWAQRKPMLFPWRELSSGLTSCFCPRPYKTMEKTLKRLCIQSFTWALDLTWM